MRRQFAILTAFAVVLTSLTGLSAVAAAEVAAEAPDAATGYERRDRALENLEAVEPTDARIGTVFELGKGEARRRYLIRLKSEPVATYRGGKQGFVATSVEGRGKLDADAPKSQRYRAELQSEQAEFVDRVEDKLGRQVEVPSTYQFSNNGLVAVLTPAEARQVAADPAVQFMQLDIERELHTDRGPQWISADDVWAASGAPLNLPADYKGEGMVIGVIDTGINPSNPSFADPGPVDGYDHTLPGRYTGYLGVCDPAHADYDSDFLCNDKLIGAYGFVEDFDRFAVDYDGHGSHTASTAGGNVVNNAAVSSPARASDDLFDISGVAPHANIIAYLGCCSLSGLTDSIEQAIIDQVDVINYSIGSSSPSNLWDDFDTVGFLSARAAGIHVATSNGNDGPGFATTGSPSDSPWITSVGATTHDRKNINSLLNMSGGDTAPPAEIFGKSVTDGLGATDIIYAGAFGDALCEDNPVLRPGDADHTADFTGKIVVCDRGVNGRVEKSENVAAQGAAGFVLANDEDSGDSLNGDAFAVPGLHITYDDGVVLKTWLATGAGHTAEIAGTTFDIDVAHGDIMAGFSSRGPNQAVDVIVPDVTAPGVDIVAAYGVGNDGENPIDYSLVDYEFVSGTSMASPHVAGALALIAQARSEWTPAEVQSALMTTAFTDVMDSDGTPADPYDMGAGRVNVANAVIARLLLDETEADYEAANPAVGGDAKTLNLPSFANSQCLNVCSWTRTVEYPIEYDGDGSVTWTATTVEDAGINSITVEPSEFTLAPGESQTITVTADVSGGPIGDHLFGRLTFTPSGVAGTPAVTMPLAVVPTTGVLPPEVEVETARDAASHVVEDLKAIEITDFTSSIAGLVKGEVTTDELSTDPTEGDAYDNVDGTTTKAYWFEVPADAKRFVAQVTMAEMPDLDMYVGRDTDAEMDVDASEEVAFSASGTALEMVDLSDPEAGDWWVLIQNWEGTGASEPDAFDLVTAVVPGTPAGNAGFDGPAGAVPAGDPFGGRLHWDLPGSAPGDLYFGVLTLGTSAGSPGDIGTIPLTVERVADDVSKSMSDSSLTPGDTATVDVTINANVTSADLNYTITETIPDGVTVDPDSITGGGVLSGDTITWEIMMPTAVGRTPMWRTATCPGSYVDLKSAFGISPSSAFDGDTTYGNAFSSLAPWPFYSEEYGALTVSEDGIITVLGGYDPAFAWVTQTLPDAAAPNGVIAALWSDLEVAYNAGAAPGDETGITLASDGATVAIIEYDAPFPYGGTVADSVGDFQIWMFNYIDPDFPEIEIYYGDMNTLPSEATIGVENIDGDQAFAVVNNADPSSVATDGGSVCLDYAPAVEPMTVSYDVTPDSTLHGPASTQTDHVTDDPYGESVSISDEFEIDEPTAAFTWTPINPAAGDAVNFDATASSDHTEDGAGEVTYSWDFDDDGVEDATGVKPTTSFDTEGLHEVTLTVTSTDLGTSDSLTRTVSVVPDLPPTADAGADKVAAVNAPVTLNGTGSDPNGGPVTYKWDPGDGSGVLNGKTVEHAYTQAGKYTATLTVTDQGGLTATDTVEITVVPGDAVDAVYRAFGNGREQTAIELSKAGWASADTVILAYSGDYPDALAAATLGAAVNAPVLQNGTKALADHNKTEIERLGASKVYVVSGPNAISEAVVDALEAMGLEVERLSGATRFHTAAAIADEIVALNGKQDQVVVALGTFWADALSSGTLATTTGSPVLLANTDSVPAETIAAIKRVLTAGGKVWMVGGPATMSSAVEAQLFAEGFDVSRLAGADRFATNVVVLNEAVSQGANLGIAVVASGGNYPDALSAAVAAWKLGGFLILVHPDDLTLSPPSAGFLVDHADDIHGALIAGGPNTIADQVVTQVANAIE